MREVKFRAYDSINKVMEYNVNVNQGKPVKRGYQWFDTSNTVRHSELMQFTGLVDKNGKEIYEGDIFKTYSKLGERYYTYPVEFENGAFYIGPFSLHPRCIKSEVIGSIYENPELLEVRS